MGQVVAIHGVRVNSLCMGATDSHMQRSFFGYGDDEATSPPPEVLAKWMDPFGWRRS